MPRIRIKPDLLVPDTISIETSTAIVGGIWMRVRAEFDETTRRYVLSEVVYSRGLAQGGLSVVELREVPVMSVVEAAVDADIRLVGSRDGLRLQSERAQNYESLQGDDKLLFAAREYAIARALGRSPLKDMAERLGVSRATAARIASRARHEGLLD